MDRHVGRLHVLGTVNRAAVNGGGGVSCTVLAGYRRPGVGLLDHMVIGFPFLKEPPYCSPYWWPQFPATGSTGGLFLCTLSGSGGGFTVAVLASVRRCLTVAWICASLCVPFSHLVVV